MEGSSKVGLYYVMASILVSTAIPISLIASGIGTGTALICSVLSYAILPAVVLVVYLRRNMHLPHGKKFRTSVAIVAVNSIMVFTALIALFVMLGTEPVSAELNGSGLDVTVPFVDEHILYSDIDGVEFRGDMDYGSRKFGYEAGKMLGGNFRNDEFGGYTLAVHRSTDECIVIRHGSGILVFNLDSSKETERFYNDLRSRLGNN